MPTAMQMARSFADAALKPAQDEEVVDGTAPPSLWARITSSMLWKDSTATSRRFLISVLLLFPAVLLGLHMAMFPYVGAFFLRFIQFFDKIVALSLLPILFIAFGIDELSKVMLIVVGVTPTIILDTFNLTKSVPREQIVKAFTLGAGDFAIAYRVIFKQILPRVLNGIRLNLKAVMLFLFAGEMIASTDGLAYRIALLRRHMGMDAIIPYVLWVALLLFLVDLAMHRTESVHVDYAVKGHATRRILNGVNLEIQSGEFVAIVGQTGCGKSTLLRLILGEERPTSGRVLVNGGERSRPDRLCGYVPQKYSLFPDKTVLDNITFALDVSEFGAFSVLHPTRRKKMRAFRDEALRYLERTGLQKTDARKYPHQLSGGMQQRVAIAQALILRPPILLMDEAFSALDPATRSGMQRLIKELWRQSETTIVFVTHNTREAICLATRIIALAICFAR